MALFYDVKYDTSFIEDLKLLRESLSEDKFKSIMKKFYSIELILTKFPRMYKRLEIKSTSKEEFRKMVLQKYIFIYEITSENIIFLKIFHEKTNYINKIKKLSRI